MTEKKGGGKEELTEEPATVKMKSGFVAFMRNHLIRVSSSEQTEI
jgi:hypothetical protein